jgi:hypothetical protein
MFKVLLTACVFLQSLFLPLESGSIADKIAQVEQVIQQDPGNRGVSHFYTTALFDAAKSLEKANHVAILTGFFIPSAQQPETDGPLGCLFLAESLAALGKQVTIVTDQYCFPAVQACYEIIQDKIPSSLLSICVFPEKQEEREAFVERFCQKIDCLVSIERVGRSVDGTYRTMRGIDITDKTAPLDDLFLYAQSHLERPIVTIGIGDGGNEIGMGGKLEEVKVYIPKGELIACTVPADHLIVTGVSNWGGYALAAALWCGANQEGNRMKEVYPSSEEQFKMLENMVLHNCCDGVLGKPALSADGLEWEVHAAILEKIRQIIE